MESTLRLSRIVLSTPKMVLLISSGLMLMILCPQYGESSCSYRFDGIENGITIDTYANNLDSVYTFTVLDQTGNVVSNKAAVLITESSYFKVEENHLIVQRCPYAGLLEEHKIGIQGIADCETNVIISVIAALPQIIIPEEQVITVDSQTEEPEIIIYEFELMNYKDCTLFDCYITCKNDGQEFMLHKTGSDNVGSSNLYISTYPSSLKYSGFKYELLMHCYDNYNYADTQVDKLIYFAFIDISMTGSEALTGHLTTYSSARYSVSTEPSTKMSSIPKPTSEAFNTDKISKTLIHNVARSSSQGSVTSGYGYKHTVTPTKGSQITSSGGHETSNNPQSIVSSNFASGASLTKRRDITSVGDGLTTVFSFLTSTMFPAKTSSQNSSNDGQSSKLLISTDGPTVLNVSKLPFSKVVTYRSGYQTMDFYRSTSMSKFLAQYTLLHISNPTVTVATSRSYNTAGDSFFDDNTNIAVSAVAGVTGISVIGTGAYALASKRCKKVEGSGVSKRTEENPEPDEDVSAENTECSEETV